MSRRQFSSNAAIDLGVARSTDFRAPTVSSRVSPKWRAPRPVSWPPALPEHRVPSSVPRSVPPNRFHEPVVHSPLLLSDYAPASAPVWPWVLVVIALAAGAGFFLRDRLSPHVTGVTSVVRSWVPSDLADRPRIAWHRAEGFFRDGVTKARLLVEAPPRVVPAAPSEVSVAPLPKVAPAAPNSQAGAEPVLARPAPAIPVSALPMAAPPPASGVAASRTVPRPHTIGPRAALSQRDSNEPASAEPTTTEPASDQTPVAPPPPKRAPAVAPPEAPASTPAPEPGSLDDLIRRAVENDKKKQR